MPAEGAQALSAIEIFDGMIHYENDQLDSHPSIEDYHCILTETTVRSGSSVRTIMEKDLYFMVPTFQLQLIDDKPAFYFDDTLLIVLLGSVELRRERDATIDDVDCYVIRTTPLDEAFRKYNRLYFVSMEDFRHVRTVSHHATNEYDDLTTEINYTYGEVGPFTLLIETSAETTDREDNPLATVTTTYTDYEFDVGLDFEWFLDNVEGTPYPPLN